MCGIRVVFSTLKALISLTDISLMTVTIKMHEKHTWRIANYSADLIQLQRNFHAFCYENH